MTFLLHHNSAVYHIVKGDRGVMVVLLCGQYAFPYREGDRHRTYEGSHPLPTLQDVPADGRRCCLLCGEVGK